MVIKSQLPLLLFVLSFFLLSATLSVAYTREDPELHQCRHQCRAQQQFGKPEQKQCEQRCEDYYREKQRRREQGGGSSDDEWSVQSRGDPERELQRCQEQCQRQQQQQRCQQRCQRKYEEQQRGQGREDEDERSIENRQDPQRELQRCQEQCQHQRQGREQQRRCQERCEEQQGREGEYEAESRQGREGEETENPYFFPQERFQRHIQGQEGNIRVLERFSRRSDLLEGIENYRLTIYEANPNTFMIPSHWDADCVCVVLNGRGAITRLREKNRETHNLEHGDIFRIRAGTTVNLVNRDNNEKLYVVELTIPVNTPGRFEAFFGPGGRDPESFFNAFSSEVLEAAFNTGRDELRKLFEGQNKGPFVRASEDQIRALSEDSSERGPWPFHQGESKSNRPYNLLHQRPTQSNRFGRYYEAGPDDYKQLRDFDVSVTFTNITKGGMFGPFYNSRSTKMALVVKGNGYLEMACPHLTQQQGGQEEEQRRQRGSSRSYQKVSARLSRGDVFVVPAGHPVVAVSSNYENLEVFCFGINAQNNHKYPLAGYNNILTQLEREAKELSFSVPARQVDEIFNKQEESWFFAGPKQHGGHASA